MLNLNPFYPQISAACRHFRVKKLELFGSGTREDFGNDSDVDFLVEFHDLEGPGIADRYFGLINSLTQTLQRPVDLVEVSSIRNPFFRKAVNAGRELVYGDGP